MTVQRFLMASMLLLMPHAPAWTATAGEPPSQDPALLAGTLPNGMRYYIRPNSTPAHRAELRLVVNAGSALEAEDQRGFAHFLEHMAFNGTTHFPKHALIEYLEDAGMRFGADLNAYTSFDETVYQFAVPTDEPRFLPDGLRMLADIAGGQITLDSSEVVAERGVVVGEWRSRMLDTASQAMQDWQDSVLYGPNSPYRVRRPIGLYRSIAHAEPGPIQRFYSEWYRPDRMAVVVIGDVAPHEAARLVRAQFGAIPRRAPGASVAPSSGVPDTGFAFTLHRGPVWPTVELVWRVRPAMPSTTAGFREQLIERLLAEHVTRRLLRLRERERRPFLQAAVGRSSVAARAWDVLSLAVVAAPDSLERGLAAALSEVERVARHGIPSPALDAQKAALIHSLEGAARSVSAIRSEQYAAAYVQHYLRGDVALRSVQQELALARAVLPSITPAELARAARFWRTRGNLTALVQWPYYSHDRPPTRESILSVLDAVARDSALGADSTGPLATADTALIAHPPTPGRIVSERHDTASGITEWGLSNGARVLFKPTRYDADALLIKAVSPGGFSLVPDSLFYGPGRLAGPLLTEAAGVGALDRDQLQRRLTGTTLRDLTVAITNNAEWIALDGSPKEAATLFALLYLQFTAPRLDSTAIRSFRQVGTNLNPTLDDNLTEVLSRGDPRRSSTPWTLIPLADAQAALAVHRDRFGNASDFTFIIVGAMRPADAKPLVERYLASLPGTGAHEVPRPSDARPWNEVLRQTIRGNQTPKASTLLVFDGLFPGEPAQYLAERRRLAILSQVLQLELTDQLRERMGGTYSVGVRDRTYFDPEPRYRLEFNFDAAPEQMDEMTDALLAVLDSVRTRGAPDAELRKAAAIQRRTREVALQDNHFWLGAIELYDRLKIPFSRIPGIPTATVMPENVRAAAQQYLPTHSFIHLTLMPADTSAAADSTSRESANAKPGY
ncbi:MAG TPA: insulinase family protein [Gemmatimonadales bacterium]|nr:insulinase family protein [Gemmatimonadales bacterium]